MTGTAPAGFTYYDAGDVWTKTANGITSTYQYDDFRNLTGISQSSGGNLATFSYDGDGKRISKLTASVHTLYLYDKEDRLLSESDANGNPICDYIYLGKDLVGKMYAPSSSGIYYYHTDPAGTPLAVTDDKAAVVWRGYYEPFGNEYAIQGTASNDVRFAGNKKDDETGLNHFGARYMDNLLGRLMAPDPVGPVDSKTGKINDKILTEPQRHNAYAYGLNGPGRYVDRDGEQVIEAYELIVFGVSVLAAVGMQQQMSKPQKDGRKGSSPSFAGESTPGTPDPDKDPEEPGRRDPKHHIFSQREDLASEFNRRGINIHEFTRQLPEDLHNALHSGGPRGGAWNQAWEEFFRSNPNATQADVYGQAGKMIYEFNIEGPLVPYR